MIGALRIIHYPDPRLRAVAEPVTEFGPPLAELTDKMFELMRQERGVGLAAPQVGIGRRLFVINPLGNPPDDRVYANPVLSNAAGECDGDEGCLSLPEIHVNVLRSKLLRIRAQDVNGKWFEEEADGYVARIWQHENDHLDGILLLDKMSSLDKLAARRAIKAMEEVYLLEHPAPAAARKRRTAGR